MKRSYLQFSDYQESIEKRNEENNRFQTILGFIKQYANANGYRELKSIYYDCDLYYYDDTKKIMYKATPSSEFNGNVKSLFVVSIDREILKHNGLV